MIRGYDRLWLTGAEGDDFSRQAEDLNLHSHRRTWVLPAEPLDAIVRTLIA